MLKRVLSGLFVMLVLSSCETNPPVQTVVQVPPAKLPPPPAEVMVKRDANYLQRLCALFWDLSATQMPQCVNFTPVNK